ncbi:glycosyltransferase family 2 protein [Myceligenerans pegani]|uniref:Glycosyltransferase n=1 Tax=Myceligenerans pegani TaxID=2776917 RepID=A0ABR9MWJ4_9MICO|nr:glycosyltransferase [Myceligenerans sp. TRM 65318]MBE1875228.1 glycosyltransferase [Myceligenerans sp. TRM 65318]MBE3017499.1 glycosyltransferase [Myceligenerans sp. TRM 65318]
MRPVISVVIPCLNGARDLPRQLDALLAQDFDGDYEIVVADNGSTDESRDVVAGYAARDPRVRGADAGCVRGINHARNVGVRHARGAFILLCDCDDEVQPGWLAAMDRARAAGGPCVGGDLIRELPDGTVTVRESGVERSTWPDVPRPFGANCGFAREVWERIGGFDESFQGGGDESDFFYRAHLAGFPTTAVPDAAIRYVERDGVRAIARQYFNYGKGRAKLFSKFRRYGMPRPAPWRVPLVVGGAVVFILVGGRGGVQRRRGIGLVANRAGRVVGSWRERTFCV